MVYVNRYARKKGTEMNFSSNNSLKHSDELNKQPNGLTNTESVNEQSENKLNINDSKKNSNEVKNVMKNLNDSVERSNQLNETVAQLLENLLNEVKKESMNLSSDDRELINSVMKNNQSFDEQMKSSVDEHLKTLSSSIRADVNRYKDLQEKAPEHDKQLLKWVYGLSAGVGISIILNIIALVT